MAERDRNQVANFPEILVHPERGSTTIPRGTRVRSADYGDGTVVADVGIGLQVWWDKPLPGTLDEHLLTHDRSWVEKLERL